MLKINTVMEIKCFHNITCFPKCKKSFLLENFSPVLENARRKKGDGKRAPKKRRRKTRAEKGDGKRAPEKIV